MVSQPGVSAEATLCLERMTGVSYDEQGQKAAHKIPHAPFRTQTEAFRFSAMVGLRLNRRTEEGQMVTKWSTDSVRGDEGTEFEKLFSHIGRERDYVDWVDAMNRCADWGARYIDRYHRQGDLYTLSELIKILVSENKDIVECHNCKVWKEKTDGPCHFCTL